jgi:V/A-type H+/Na+-transporting ATPase subunit I
LGVARLTKVTIISPRSEYADVAKALAQFEDFHPFEGAPPEFDPGVQELTVKAVRLYAQADQAVKDLGLQLMPGQMDIVFRGAKVPTTKFEAADWEELLGKAEAQLAPITEEVRDEKALLQKAQKDEADSGAMKETLRAVSGFSSNLAGLADLRLFKAVVSVVSSEKLAEFRNSLPDALFAAHALSKDQMLVLAAVTKADEGRLDKAMKLLELKSLVIPTGFPHNPAQAFQRASQEHNSAAEERKKAEAQMAKSKLDHGSDLLALRELSDVARKTLDEARVSGGMRRMAMISGYIPAKKEDRLKEVFGRWIVHTEVSERGAAGEHVPTLMENRSGLGLFQRVTLEQGIPAEHEVDPTPIVSFVFPVFFGMMFGDVGHGLILTLFMLLVRHRSTGSMRQWANIFLVAGVSAMVFGAVFGEFFELSLYNFVPIPPLIEIIHRAAGTPDTFDITGVYLVMEIAILLGVAHLITALGLDIYEGAKEHNRLELWLEKIPVLTMYVSGVGYGLAFVGVGFSFNVLQPVGPAPLLPIPNDVLGAISIAVLVPSMLVLLAGKAVAIKAGKIKGGSVLGALSNGGLEVFERISQFMSNTVSYVRLAVMLLVHAALLLITNLYFGPSGILAPWPELIPIWIVFNLLIVMFEAFIVYVQDLRLHLYEFFTKFYSGTGKPFRKIFPDRARVTIKWI